MERAVSRFVRLCRLAGLRISVSEAVDAMRTAALPGVLADRRQLRDAFEVTLVKDVRDLAHFDRIFEAFFGLRPVLPPGEAGHTHGHEDLDDEAEAERFTLSEDPSRTPQQDHSHGKPADIRDYFEEEDLAQQYNLHQEANKIDIAALTDEIVLSADRTSALSEASRVELTVSRLRTSSTPGDLVRGVRDSLDISLSVAQEFALLDWLADQVGSDDALDPEALARLRRQVSGLLTNLPQRLREHLEKLLALEQIEIDSPGRSTSPPHDPLQEEQRADLEESLRRLVRTFHGAPRARRKVSARGRVDGSRTARASMRYDGLPFRPVTVSKPHDRPRLVVLVDVSMSVRATSRFTLHVVHSLQHLVSQVRSWAFVADVRETTDFLAERQAEDALGQVMSALPGGLGLDLDADSDYGRVFECFLDEHATALSRRSTLVVLGDGRGNGHDPNVAAFEEMARRVRETVWLTPEPSYSWRLGRCDLPLYAEHCSRVQVVRDLRGLDRLASA